MRGPDAGTIRRRCLNRRLTVPLPKTLKDLLTLPTAAFVEGAVIDYVRKFCAKLPGVTLEADRYGNLLARYTRGTPAAQPVCFVAHMDHPGFVAIEMVDRSTVRAAFRGGVKSEYFKGARAKFWSGGGWIPARVMELTRVKPLHAIGWSGRPEEALLKVAGPVEPNAPGMWDLPDPVLKGDLVVARGCDDIAGAASMLALLERLSRKQAAASAYCLFTRAEEVGFIGAIGAMRAGTVPKHMPVVSIECSSERCNAHIGQGPILRVGDWAAIFTPSLTYFLERVARGLAEKRKSFRFQRALMDGGRCEAFAFQAYGYEHVTGVCVALGNYHNMDAKRGRIGSEYISLHDWRNMVEWFEAIVLDATGYTGRESLGREAIDTEFAMREPLLLG
jgi:endoglucanase